MVTYIGSYSFAFGVREPRPESGPYQFDFGVFNVENLAKILKGEAKDSTPRMDSYTIVKISELENICDRIGFFEQLKVEKPVGEEKLRLEEEFKKLIKPLIQDRIELHEAIPRIFSAGMLKGKLAGRVLKPDHTIDRLFLTFTFENPSEDGGAFLPYLRLGQEYWINRLANKEEPPAHQQEIQIVNKRLCQLAAEKFADNQINKSDANRSPARSTEAVADFTTAVMPPRSLPPSREPTPPPKLQELPKQSFWGGLWSGVGAAFEYITDFLMTPFRWLAQLINFRQG